MKLTDFMKKYSLDNGEMGSIMTAILNNASVTRGPVATNAESPNDLVVTTINLTSRTQGTTAEQLLTDLKSVPMSDISAATTNQNSYPSTLTDDKKNAVCDSIIKQIGMDRAAKKFLDDLSVAQVGGVSAEEAKTLRNDLATGQVTFRGLERMDGYLDATLDNPAKRALAFVEADDSTKTPNVEGLGIKNAKDKIIR